MLRGGPRRFSPGERDRRLAEEVLYLHSLWRRGPPAPAPAPAPIQSRSPRLAPAPASASVSASIQPRPAPGLIQYRSARRWERELRRIKLAARRKERKRRRRARAFAAAAAEPQDTRPESALGPPPPTSSPEIWAEAAASTPSTSNPPPPTTSTGSLSQREALRSSVELSNRESADVDEEGSQWDGEEMEEEEALKFFTRLFERDAALRGRYERRWKKGPFNCMVCAAAGRKAGREFRGCGTLVQHAHGASRYGVGAHRALAAVVCRVLGWDFNKLPRFKVDPRGTLGQALAAQAKAGVQRQHPEEDDDTEDNNGYSTSEDEENEDEEEGVEIGVEDPGTNGAEEGNEIESNEEYTEKEDHENGMEDSSADGNEEANEQERSIEAAQKEENADESIEELDDSTINRCSLPVLSTDRYFRHLGSGCTAEGRLSSAVGRVEGSLGGAGGQAVEVDDAAGAATRCAVEEDLALFVSEYTLAPKAEDVTSFPVVAVDVVNRNPTDGADAGAGNDQDLTTLMVDDSFDFMNSLSDLVPGFNFLA